MIGPNFIHTKKAEYTVLDNCLHTVIFCFKQQKIWNIHIHNKNLLHG